MTLLSANQIAIIFRANDNNKLIQNYEWYLVCKYT